MVTKGVGNYSRRLAWKQQTEVTQFCTCFKSKKRCFLIQTLFFSTVASSHEALNAIPASGQPGLRQRIGEQNTAAMPVQSRVPEDHAPVHRASPFMTAQLRP